jgi:hypothetical protein
MDSVKATPQEIFQVLEQQKKLQDMRLKLLGVLDKVNQTMNSITVSKQNYSGILVSVLLFQVENLELTSCQIENFDERDESIDKKPNIQQNTVQQDLLNQQRAEEINQQLVDLELKFSHYEAESDESEIDL